MVSDDSDADGPMTVDVRKLDGGSISGKGYILEGSELDFTVHSAPNTADRFVVEKNSTLVSGSLYLIVSGSKEFDLTGHMFTENPYVGSFGLRLSLYDNNTLTGTPAASAEFFDDTIFVM